jgi:hypothetical protein
MDMFKKLNFRLALSAGTIATGAMTLLMYTAPLMGLPKMDIMLALGSLFPWKISPYIPGVILHFGIGIVLALLYALFFANLLPGPRWVRGALYAFLPWLLAIFAMGPMMAMVQSWTTPAMTDQAMNPCAVVNPCAGITRPANPCAALPVSANPGNPVQPQAVNPCAAQTTQAANPCSVVTPQALNPCGAVAGSVQTAPNPVIIRLMSLVAHLLYGTILGLLYRPRQTMPADNV